MGRTHSNRKPSVRVAWTVVLLQIGVMLLWGTPAMANPEGGVVVGGSASISSSGSTLNVNSASQRAVINWQGFSINNGEVTNFNMPNSNAAVLNRVVSGNPSAIYGALNSNGKVYLINPNGIMVGPTGQINVNSFVASTLNVPDTQFMNNTGELNFAGTSGASIVNHGQIRALEGDIYLIGASVQNHGGLYAPNGVVGMAAGQDVRLVDSAHPHLTVRPTSQSFGGTGVHNTGTIEAMQAELMAAGGNIYALAINNEGTIRANGSAEIGGRIYLVSDGGNIRSSGTLVAKKGVNGGDVIVHAGGQEGSSVVLSGTIDVSGEETGGVLFVKAGMIDISDAYVNMFAPIPGEFILSVGPHSVAVTNTSIANPLHWGDTVIVGSGSTLTDSDHGVVGAAKFSSATQTLEDNGTGVNVVGGAPLVDLVLQSADPNQPFLKSVSINLEQNGPVASTTEILFTLVIREPDGSFVTNYLVLDPETFSNTKFKFNATAGELIKTLTINSNQYGYTSAPIPVAINGPGGSPVPTFNQVKQVGGDLTIATATILIVDKQTTPGGDPTKFGFRLSNATPTILNDFGLADPDAPLAFVLTPGVFSLNEGTWNLPAGTFSSGLPTGWFLTGVDFSAINSANISAANDESPITSTNGGLSGTTQSVNLTLNETVTLVFHNAQGGTITVTKVVTGTSDSNTNFAFTGTGPATVTPFNLTGGDSQVLTLLPGTYTISEGSLPTGWFYDGATGTGVTAAGSQGGQYTVTAGGSTTMTFTNTQGGQITVVKNATGPGGAGTLFNFTTAVSNGGSTVDTAFDLNGGTSDILDSTLANYVRPGTYTVAELAETGWFFDGITPSGLLNGTTATAGGVVTLTAGGAATLTFANTQGAQITVVKNTIGPAGATTAFDFTATGATTDTSFAVNGGGGSRVLDSTELVDYVRPGSYSVTELAELGWFFDSVGGSGVTALNKTGSVTVAAGDTRTITFANTQGAQIVVSKIANGPAGPTTPFGFTAGSGEGASTVTPALFSLNGGGSLTLDSEQVGYLRPGSYTVAELAAAGWIFDGVVGADLVNGQQATVNLAAGEIVNMVFTNSQIPLISNFRYDPIYPTGVGFGGLGYGGAITRTPASSPDMQGLAATEGAGAPGVGVADGSSAPGVVPGAPGEELVADESEDIRKKRVAAQQNAGPKRVLLGGGGESSFEAFSPAGAGAP